MRKQKQSIFDQFYKNLRYPRKSSLFRFQRVGHNILYAFSLTLFAALFFSPTVISATIKAGQSFSFIFLPVAMIYYYIVLTFLFFSYASLLSLGGFWFAKLIKRRVNGQQAWGLAVNACTWPTVLFSVVNLFYSLPSFTLFGYVILTALMLLINTTAVPKPRVKSAQSGLNYVHK